MSQALLSCGFKPCLGWHLESYKRVHFVTKLLHCSWNEVTHVCLAQWAALGPSLNFDNLSSRVYWRVPHETACWWNLLTIATLSRWKRCLPSRAFRGLHPLPGSAHAELSFHTVAQTALCYAFLQGLHFWRVLGSRIDRRETPIILPTLKLSQWYRLWPVL